MYCNSLFPSSEVINFEINPIFLIKPLATEDSLKALVKWSTDHLASSPFLKHYILPYHESVK